MEMVAVSGLPVSKRSVSSEGEGAVDIGDGGRGGEEGGDGRGGEVGGGEEMGRVRLRSIEE